MKRSSALAQCFTAGVIALAIFSANNPAHAQSADLVLCDRLAADPADPDKPADVKGVASVAPADVATAIKFCKQASGARRAMYQLCRAYAADRQSAEAIGAWRKAADKGSTSAMVELGVAYATGAGIAKDEAAAALKELVKQFQQSAGGRTVAGVLPMQVPFPEYGTRVFLASELTPEARAPKLVLEYQRERGN